MGIWKFLSLLHALRIFTPSIPLAFADQPIEFSSDELLQIARKEPRIRQAFQGDYSLQTRNTNEFNFYSKDGRQVIIEGINKKASAREILWINAYSGKIEKKLDLKTLNLEPEPWFGNLKVYFTDDASKIIFFTGNQYWIWDAQTNKSVKLETVIDMNDSKGSLQRALLSPDGSKVLLYDFIEYPNGKKALNRLQLFDAKTGRLLSSNDLNAKTTFDALSWQMSWSPDSQKILVNTQNGKTFLVDDLKTLALKSLPKAGHAIPDFSSDSKEIIAPEAVFGTGKTPSWSYSVKTWDLKGNLLSTTALPQSFGNGDWNLGVKNEKMFMLRKDDTLELIDLKSKQAQKLFNGGLIPPHDIAVSPNRDSAISWSSGDMTFHVFGSPANIAASARRQVASLLEKKSLSAEEKKLLDDLLPYFFEPDSPYTGLKSPLDPELHDFYTQLSLAKTDPKRIKPEVFSSELLTPASVRILAKGAQGHVGLTIDQAKNALKILGQDEWLKPSDLESLSWLAKESGLSASEVFQFFQSAPYYARMEVQKRLGLQVPAASAPPHPTSELNVNHPSTPLAALDYIRSQKFSRSFACLSDEMRIWSGDGRFIACWGSQSSTLLIHDVQKGTTQTANLPEVKSGAFSFSFSEDSSRLYFSSSRKNQSGWFDLKAGTMHRIPYQDLVDVFPSQDGKKAFFGGPEVFIYDADSGQKTVISEISDGSYGNGRYDATFTSDNKKAILWSSDNNLLIVDTGTGKVEKKLKAQRNGSMRVSPDGQKLYVVSSIDYAIIDLPSGKDILRESHDFNWPHRIRFGNGVLYDYNPALNEISVFDLETGKVIEKQKTSSFNSKDIVDVSFSPPKVLKTMNNAVIVQDLMPKPPEVEKMARVVLKELWNKPALDSQERELLLKLMDEEHGLPADATLKDWVQTLRVAKRSPENLTAAALDVNEETPLDYYRVILEAVRSPAALQARQKDPISGQESNIPKFNPTPAQAMRVLRKILEDSAATAKDQEAAAWLLVRSGANIDESTLDLFKFSPQELRDDVDTMLATNPWKYKGFSSLAAIKLAKVLMDFKDEDFACEGINSDGVGGVSKENNISSILTWFGTYGNNPSADRLLFAKLARLILSKRKLCPRDRNLLIRAMNDWKAGNAPVQHEVACVVGEQLAKTSFKDRGFEESVLIAQSVGLRSQLSWASWIEQMRALGQVRAQRPGPMQDDEKDIYAGLVHFVVGNPEGQIQLGSTALKVPQSPEMPKSIVRLCRNLIKKMELMNTDKERITPEDVDFIQGASLFLQKMRFDLDEARQWPEGFQTNASKASLRQEFEQKNLQDDLKALESNCTELPQQDSKSQKPLSVYQEEEQYQVFSKPEQKEKPAVKSKPSVNRPRRTKPKDFNPDGRF